MIDPSANDVLAAILATTATALGVGASKPFREARRRRALWLSRSALRERRRARRTLGKKLTDDGQRIAWKGHRLSGRQLRAVLGSFERLRGADGSFLATELLATADAEPVDAYLVNGDSGFGKTTLALALAATHPRRVPNGRIRIVPIYFDTSNTGFAGALTAWVTSFSELTQDGRAPVRDRAVLILDAINESQDTTEVVRGLARHLDFLRANHIALVFMFSYRHKSYAGELISALADVGLADVRTVSLDAVTIPSAPADYDADGNGGVLPSYCALAAPSERSGLMRDLATYRSRHSDWAPTRLGVASVIRWRDPKTDWQRTAPEEILVRQILETSMARVDDSQAPLKHLARCAFLMLGDEQVIFSLDDLARKTEGSSRAWSPSDMAEELRPWMKTSHAERLGIDLSETEIRIDNEAAIRVLGALHVAFQLQPGARAGKMTSDGKQTRFPRRLSGRTTYDVCAPFVLPALRWLADHASGHRLDRSGLRVAVLDELSSSAGADGLSSRWSGLPPFSFFGALGLATDRGSDSGMDAEEIRFAKALFLRLIDEIDADRTCTCHDAIRRARRDSNLPFPNPVLDQLFELTERCQRHAVRPLLAILNDSGLTHLQRSQAAYLLVAWLRSVVASPLVQTDRLSDRHDRALVDVIASEVQMSPNLHVRFHVLEIAHALLTIHERSIQSIHAGAKRLIEAACSDSPSDAAVDPLREALDLFGRLPLPVKEINTDTARSLFGAILAGPPFNEPFCDAHSDEELERWEVALALASRWYRSDIEMASGRLETFILSTLEHPLWIVRWWGFVNLVALLEFAAQKRLDNTAGRYADIIVARIFAPCEPIGLKQQQCKRIEDLIRARAGGRAARHLGARLRHARRALDDQAFVAAYSKVLGQPADQYLAEYFGRVDRLLAYAA